MTVRVTDPDGSSDTDTFTITVDSVNDTPVLSGLPDRSLDEDTTLNNTIDLWVYASDVETADSGLVFTIVGNSNPSCGASIDSSGYIDIQPAANWYGTSDVTVRATDPDGSSDTDTFTITVISVNDQPWINPTVPDQHADTNMAIAVDLTFYENDVENSDTSLDWYVVGGVHCTTAGEYSDGDVLTFTPDVDFTGSETVTLHLQDAGGAEDTQQVRLTWETRVYLPITLKGH